MRSIMFAVLLTAFVHILLHVQDSTRAIYPLPSNSPYATSHGSPKSLHGLSRYLTRHSENPKQNHHHQIQNHYHYQTRYETHMQNQHQRSS